MKSADWLKVAARLEREAGTIKYGTVGVTVQVHEGEICKIRYNRQDCEAFEVTGKKEKREK